VKSVLVNWLPSKARRPLIRPPEEMRSAGRASAASHFNCLEQVCEGC